MLDTPTKTDNNGIFEGEPSVDGAVLTYKLVNDGQKKGQTGTITVPVTSTTNYNAFDLTITVTVTDKFVPTLAANPITITYTGEAVPDTAIKGTATVDGKNVPGTWSFAENQALTNVADSGTKTVKFVPTDKDNYAEATGTVVVTINKATPTARPSTNRHLRQRQDPGGCETDHRGEQSETYGHRGLGPGRHHGSDGQHRL